MGRLEGSTSTSRGLGGLKRGSRGLAGHSAEAAPGGEEGAALLVREPLGVGVEGALCGREVAVGLAGVAEGEVGEAAVEGVAGLLLRRQAGDVGLEGAEFVRGGRVAAFSVCVEGQGAAAAG